MLPIDRETHSAQSTDGLGPTKAPAGKARPAAADQTQTMPERRRSGSGSGSGPIANNGSESGSGRNLKRSVPASTPPSPSLLGDQARAVELPADSPDRYELDAEHARGGLGRVLKARDGRLGRTVAIKELLRTSEVAESRFIREALITARLQHPGIVPVHEAGRWPSGDPYYVMPLIAGESLKQLIRDRGSLQERLALLPNVIAVAETIAYAHSEAVIHRDLKPSNVVVGEFGETVVVDWGLAKDLRAPAGDDDDDDGDTTSSGGAQTAGVMGTPAFMPPEQAEGETVSERADVYSLGAMLYNVLAGEPPYSGSEASDVVAKVLAGAPTPVDSIVSGIPRDLLAIVRKAMARDPNERYPTARELTDDLKRFQTGQLVTAYEYSRLTLVQRWLWRNRLPVAIAAAAVVLVAVIGALGVKRVVEERNVAQSQREQAEIAQHKSQRRSTELLFLQAKTSMDKDPTAAMAWLKRYPPSAPNFAALPQMIDEARARGVARHVFRLGDWATGVAFSPDAKSVATTDKSGEIKIWDIATGTGRLLGSHDMPMGPLQYSPDGTLLATTDNTGVIKLWDVDAGTFTELTGHDGEVGRFVFTSDGRHLVSAGRDRTGRVWDIATGEQIYQLGPNTEPAEGAFSPDGDFATVLGLNGTLTVYDMINGTNRSVTVDLPGGIARVAAAHGGTHTALLTKDNQVHVIDAATGEVRKLGVHPGAVEWLTFSPTNRYILSTSTDHTVRLFDTTAGVDEPMRIFRGHTDAVYQAAFSADERYVVSAGDDGTARVWTTQTGASHVLSGHTDDVWRVAVSPDGTYIATGSLDSTVRVWSTTFDDSRPLVGTHTNKFVSVLATTGEGELVLYAINDDLRVFDPDTGTSRPAGTPAPIIESMMKIPRGVVYTSADGRFAAARNGSSVDLWTLADGTKRELKLHEDKVYGLAFSPDGATLATAGADGTVVAWNTTTGEHRVIAKGGPVTALGFAPDGDVLALGVEGNVLLWSVDRMELVREIDVSKQCGDRYIQALAFSGDGEHLVVLAHGSSYPVIELDTGDMLELATGGHTMVDVQFSPDNTLVAAAVADRTVRVWDLATGEVAVLEGHRDLVMQVRFSPDSQTLASGSYDDTIRLWQRNNGWKSRVLRGHSGSVDALAFMAGGAVLASASRDGTIRLWDPALDATADADAITARLDALTSTVIADDDRPATP